ncbi:hypothetical protein [Nocardioides aurantiacus]|uniref:Uncharacterized protein n=1 Tax=Nocardioides aurantiacus TaxID=86796 RepID=A0A3N2CTQ2_9ACTN|nr:hypothetical protein [Nocardioides aurantiacus]ROR90907.1 hypothetical protein EDD33_1756 [Nocardioides aurantiacus]
MADVVLGRAGSPVLVDLNVCAKTGRRTSDRVERRGSTMPAWVTLLLLFTVVGFLLAGAMTSRSYRVTLPLEHAVHDRWRRNRRLAWAVSLVGAGAFVWAESGGTAADGLWGGVGLALFLAGLVGGTVNSTMNNVGFRMTRQDDLVLTRAHDNFARAVAAATVEAMPPADRMDQRRPG